MGVISGGLEGGASAGGTAAPGTTCSGATPSNILVRKLALGPPSAKVNTSPSFKNASLTRFPFTNVPLVLWSTSLKRFPSRIISACFREMMVRSLGKWT